MKVLFLDIDGVLNSDDFFESFSSHELLDPNIKTKLSPALLSHLAYIIDQSSAVIVISSRWRRFFGDQKIGVLLSQSGIKFTVYSHTPMRGLYDQHYLRGNEITEWIKSRLYRIESYAILDDKHIRGHDAHFVQTNPVIGLSLDDAKRVVDILNRIDDQSWKKSFKKRRN